RRRHTRSKRDWSSDVCSSDLLGDRLRGPGVDVQAVDATGVDVAEPECAVVPPRPLGEAEPVEHLLPRKLECACGLLIAVHVLILGRSHGTWREFAGSVLELRRRLQ